MVLAPNWQLVDFGGRLHSFAEDETMMKSIAEFMPPPRIRLTVCSTTSFRTPSRRNSD